MNIFVLDLDPQVAASYHCDRHVLKMIIEYSQLLSTAHRILDGEPYVGLSKSGRKVRRWRLPEAIDDKVYQATHVNHPCAVWARTNAPNYGWLWCLTHEVSRQYTERYGKIHKCQSVLCEQLAERPKAFGSAIIGKYTPFPLAMPDKYKSADPVESYRAYYLGEKMGFAKWAHSETPPFIQEAYAHVLHF